MRRLDKVAPALFCSTTVRNTPLAAEPGAATSATDCSYLPKVHLDHSTLSRRSPIPSSAAENGSGLMRDVLLCLCIALLAPISPVMATPVAPHDPPWSASRIQQLPPAIRRIVLSRCGPDAQAGHYFATYDHNSNIVHLDYSLLQCGRPQRLCSTSCLKQTFVMSHGRYALTRSHHKSTGSGT
jgi:hypothetical protein